MLVCGLRRESALKGSPSFCATALPVNGMICMRPMAPERDSVRVDTLSWRITASTR